MMFPIDVPIWRSWKVRMFWCEVPEGRTDHVVLCVWSKTEKTHSSNFLYRSFFIFTTAIYLEVASEFLFRNGTDGAFPPSHGDLAMLLRQRSHGAGRQRVCGTAALGRSGRLRRSASTRKAGLVVAFFGQKITKPMVFSMVFQWEYDKWSCF